MIYFVVPIYNVEEYLNKCVDSLVSQTRSDIHIILVDDGSSDNSPKICDEYEKKFENITCIHKSNGGLSSARNAGIEYAMSKKTERDYISFIDSDDFVRPIYAEQLVYLCEKYFAEVAQPAYEKGALGVFTTNGRATEDCVSSRDALLGYKLKSQSTPKMYRLSLFDDVRFPEGVWNEDEFVTYKLVHKSVNVVFTDEVLYYYYQRDGSIMSEIAKKLKDSPRKNDWQRAYSERIEYFKRFKDDELVQKTYEKICTDVILRYCEQNKLPKKDRDEEAGGKPYLKLYNDSYKKMKSRKGIPLKKRLMYFAFRICPASGVLASKVFTLRN